MTPTDYPRIDLSAWTKVGEGGNGCTYELPSEPDVLLKLNNARSSDLATVHAEFERSAAVARLGLPTPAMHRIVRVGDAYGVIAERIKEKKSLFRICHDQPERIDEMARLFCEQGKRLFATPCDTGSFPSRKKTALQGIDQASFISRKQKAILRSFVETVPDGTGCVHGDFQGGNLILSQGRPYWIDLGRFAYGDPMFDLGHLYLSCVVYSRMKQARDIFHMTREQLLRFWDTFAKAYTGQEDHAAFDREVARYAAADILMRTCYSRPTFLEGLFFRMHVNHLMRYFDA